MPFAALRDPATGRFLAERFALATVPSARALRRSGGAGATPRRQPPATRAGDRRSPLRPPSVPDPRAPAEQRCPKLAPSPPPTRRVSSLVGLDATPERFLADAPSFDVIHLATHAVDFPEDPTMASLLLAPGPGSANDGILPARDLRFPSPLSARVVVLAACRTAEGRISASEGPLNLARPFLAAGAPSVVATLWALDDATSLAFSERFHAALAAGAAPIDAFHSAQLDLLRSPDPRLSAPRSWAGLVLIGATARREAIDSPTLERINPMAKARPRSKESKPYPLRIVFPESSTSCRSATPRASPQSSGCWCPTSEVRSFYRTSRATRSPTASTGPAARSAYSGSDELRHCWRGPRTPVGTGDGKAPRTRGRAMAPRSAR